MKEQLLSANCFRFSQAPAHFDNEQVEKYANYLFQADPLADNVVRAFAAMPGGYGVRLLEKALDKGIDAISDAPKPLCELFAQLDEVPFWVDWQQLDRGGSVFLRSGLFGVLTIGLASLPLSYSSPAGNKPLVFSGQLVKRAARRLGETGHFVYLTSQPGGLRRYSAGFKAHVKVRLMHAQIRRLLWESGRWESERWGEPLNQAYMAATNLMLSVVLLDGMRRFGLRCSAADGEALMQLWRYSGYLSGISPELLSATESEARRMLDMVFSLDAPPDQDSQELIRALMQVAHSLGLKRADWLTKLFYGLSHSLIGQPRAASLGYPKTWHRFVLPTLRPLIQAGDFIRRQIPGGQSLIDSIGTKGWNLAIQYTLAGPSDGFPLAERLASECLKEVVA